MNANQSWGQRNVTNLDLPSNSENNNAIETFGSNARSSAARRRPYDKENDHDNMPVGVSNNNQ